MATIVYLMRLLPGSAFARLGSGFILRGGHRLPLERRLMVEEARGARVLVPTFLDRVDAALLEALPDLRHVASYGVGTDHIALDACRARGILVTNTPEVLTEATADLTWALILATARRLGEGERLIRRGDWRTLDVHLLHGANVFGKTLGVVGFGRIGQAVARRARGFSMNVLYVGPREVPCAGATRVDLDTLLAASDFVSLHCPLTPTTRGLLGREHLARMKPGSILINTARGAIVDEDALLGALTRGPLAAAGIDVFPDEPNVSARLRVLENVVLLPHLGSATRETREAMAEMVAEEIVRVGKGEVPRCRVA